MTVDLAAAIETLCEPQDLSQDEAERLFAAVIAGEVSEIGLAALLALLKAKGETPEEVAGAALALRRGARAFDTGELEVADSCGTGGDGAHTLNLSTASAFVAAAGGVKVAKHGNRSVSSKCGSADVLEALGVSIETPPEVARRCLEIAGICFLYAPQYHAGVRHAMPVRRGLGVRTIFNLLGPLANPARPAIQLMGVYDPRRCRTLAETLGRLGCRRALVVHGGGLDEIALHAETEAAFLDDGRVTTLTLRPEDVGLPRVSLDALAGGEPEDNAQWLQALLAGEGDAEHEAAVAINAGALLWLADQAADHREGTARALAILRAGQALRCLEQLVEVSGGAG
ncbi:MAG: anthranilate phosphoribosyltransferase [Polyangiaceae bacterium]